MPVLPLLLFLFLGPGSLFAQSPDSVLAPLVSKSGMVRLRGRGVEATGRLLALTAGVATLQTETGNRTAALASVDSIWVRGHATRTGAIVGAAVGSVLFGAFVAAVAAGLCETDCDNEGLKGAVVGGVLGAAGGGLLGAGIGILIPKWRLRFP